jgi:hypothetical protein
MDAAIGGPGSKLKISFDGSLFHHGHVMDCETDAGEDDGYTVYNSTDVMEMWAWRPARDPADGDFSKPTFIEDYITGPQIMQAILDASYNAGGGPPSDAEGDLFIEFGTFAGGGVSLTGAPVDWPMTIMQIAALLISTGELDIILTPIDGAFGEMARVDCYNGDYGTDLSGSVVFEYGTGALNVRRMRWNEDMSGICNKLWYYGGPQIGTAADPAGNQHWCWNITGDDPLLANPPGGDIDYSNPLGDRRLASQAAYGVRMDIKIFDALSDLCLGEGAVDPGRSLYRRLWQIEQWLRCVPRNLVHVTPIRGYGIGSFDIGDLVGVEAAASVRGGFSGAQRVYGYTVSWDEDGPFELSELQTSADQEGF